MRRDSGQVGVETALAMPMTLFLVLGILQLSMIQQARLLTQYAAYRAVRAGALLGAGAPDETTWCKQMNKAAVEGLLPSIGRTDTAKNLAETWLLGNHRGEIPVANIASPAAAGLGIHIVRIKYLVLAQNGTAQAPYQTADFDDPDHPLTLTIDLAYNFKLQIPFADYMIHEMWTGQNYLGTATDQLVPASKSTKNLGEMVDAQHAFNNAKSFDKDTAIDGDASKLRTLGWGSARTEGNNGDFFIPLRASYSMRMMANLPTSVSADGKPHKCTTSM